MKKLFFLAVTLVTASLPSFAFNDTLSIEQRLFLLENRMNKAEKKVANVAADVKKRVRVVKLSLDTLKTDVESSFININANFESISSRISSSEKRTNDSLAAHKKAVEGKIKVKADKSKVSEIEIVSWFGGGLAFIVLLLVMFKRKGPNTLESDSD